MPGDKNNQLVINMKYKYDNMKCKIPGCKSPARSNGMCMVHYGREYEKTNKLNGYRREYNKAYSHALISLKRNHKEEFDEIFRRVFKWSG